jgi:hypothetical protein
MKRIFFLAVGALSLTLFSFVAPGSEAAVSPQNSNLKKTGANGITRVGPNMYLESATTKFTAQEQATIDQFTKERYHISNLQLRTGVMTTESAEAKFFFTRREIWTDKKFERYSIIGDAAIAPGDNTASAVDAILARYADSK